MAIVELTGGIAEGSPLYDIMMARDIIPGEQPSYMACKTI